MQRRSRSPEYRGDTYRDRSSGRGGGGYEGYVDRDSVPASRGAYAGAYEDEGHHYRRSPSRSPPRGRDDGAYERRGDDTRWRRGDGYGEERSGSAGRPYRAERRRSPSPDAHARSGGGVARSQERGVPPPPAAVDNDDRFRDEDDSEDEAPSRPPAPAPAPAPGVVIPDGWTEEEAMARLMGFTDFDTTHGKKVDDNYTTAARGAVAKVTRHEYRQYMHRKGGFNRELDPQKPVRRGGGGGGGGGKAK